MPCEDIPDFKKIYMREAVMSLSKVRKFYFRHIAIVVLFGLFIIGSVPSQSMAYVIGSETQVTTRADDMARVQRVLESKMVSERLSEIGLTPDEINARIDKLTDPELHSFAAQLDSLYPGGDAVGAVIGLLIIVILVILILKLLDKKIVIK